MSEPKPRMPLNDCGCCEGQTASTPSLIDNRHGLESVSYRIGDYHRFRDTMLARLSSSELPSLQKLTTRDNNDFSIALIDAWANVSEVLSFYQQYFANESFLGTAKERLSVLEHARLIGYELNPGVAASSYLAFTMDEPLTEMDNPVLRTLVPANSQVQSTPGPDEVAQIFETLEDIQARVRWNALRPRMSQPQVINQFMHSVVIEGTTTFINAGDELLLIDQANQKYVDQVTDVLIDENTQTTKLILSSEATSPNTYSVLPKDSAGSFSLFDGHAEVNESVTDLFVKRSWAIEDIVAIADTKHWDIEEIARRINAHPDVVANISVGKGVHGFHKRANLFGYNAMKRVTYKGRVPKDISKWKEWPAKENDSTLYLDNEYADISPGSYIVMRNASQNIFELSAATTTSRTEYGISSQSSKLTLASGSAGFSSQANAKAAMSNIVRKSIVLVQSESLPLAAVAISENVKGETILLGIADLDLRSQQIVAITGERVDQPGIQHSEVLQIDKVRLEHGFTELSFTKALRHEYRRETVTINANVATASHGESVSEVLGSGDASVASQRFTLKQTPLTYISAKVPGGALSSLEIRVDDILWAEVESFLGRGADERIYTTKLNDDGTLEVLFGNGAEGARLPSGSNNIIARYRKGIGLGGMIKARQANLLLTQPLGIKGVINPVKASGADDPEVLQDARVNAPLGLLTLGRTVSLSDYEDFCRAFAGVAKARAIATSFQGVSKVIMTIAGPNGELLDSSSETYENLLAALEEAGDPYTNFTILPYRPTYFKVDAGLYIHSDYLSDLVLQDARQSLRAHFSFDQREFNQAVHLSEVIQTLQKVDGVIAVDVNALHRSSATPSAPPPRTIFPQVSTGSLSGSLGAELITLDPAPLDQLRVKT